MLTSSGRPPVPNNPIFVSFYHPTNKNIFLSLPKNNVLPSITSEIFGVHHEIAPTACQIIACNEPGFLSTSTNRSDINARVSLEHYQFLTFKKYYYHLVTQPGDPNYRICINFAFWSFPHNHLPLSWARAAPVDDAGFRGSNLTDISSSIKQRDPNCRVSGWIDNRSTAHIVPVDEIEWMQNNGMDVYAAIANETLVHQDSRNLFALRWDIHTFQFDSGNLVIVPVDGRMVTHFIGTSHESAARYHNNPFDSSNLSHEFLFARFAWAIIKNAHTTFMSHSAAGQKAFSLKTAPLDEEEEAMGSDDGNGDKPINPQQKSGITSGQKGKGTKRKQPDSSGLKDPVVREADELDEDIAKAKKVAPFFLESEGVANPYAYENMMWYPGSGIAERKKSEYMDAHPNIRAYSEMCTSSDVDSISGGTLD